MAFRDLRVLGGDEEALAWFLKAAERREICDRCRSRPAAMRLDLMMVLAGRPAGTIHWLCGDCGRDITDFLAGPSMLAMAERRDDLQKELAERSAALRSTMDEARVRLGMKPRPAPEAARRRAGARPASEPGRRSAPEQAVHLRDANDRARAGPLTGRAR
jgi:hypothetical protein